jgi:hypothetical protein
LSIRSHRNRLVAIVAAIALIAMSAVYSAHGYGDLLRRQHTHCDLCVHFSGTAGAPVQATVVGKPVLVVRLAPERSDAVLPSRRRVSTSLLPRGPPV